MVDDATVARPPTTGDAPSAIGRAFTDPPLVPRRLIAGSDVGDGARPPLAMPLEAGFGLAAVVWSMLPTTVSRR